MPVQETTFDKTSFDPGTLRALTAALDVACRTLGECDPDTRKRLAARIVAGAESGERDVHKLALFAIDGIDQPAGEKAEEIRSMLKVHSSRTYGSTWEVKP